MHFSLLVRTENERVAKRLRIQTENWRYFQQVGPLPDLIYRIHQRLQERS